MTRTEHDTRAPGSLDAMVAAPEHHTVVLENDRVRVIAIELKP